MINNKERNTEPWCNPAQTRKLLLKVPLTLSWLPAILNINCTILTNHSSSPHFHKAFHRTSLGTWSKAFSKSKNAKHRFFIFAKYLCNCLKIKMGFGGSTFWHKTELHLLNVYLLSNQLFNNFLSYLQNIIF